MRFLPGLLEGKAFTQQSRTSTSATERAAGAIAAYSYGVPYRANWGIDRAVSEGLEGNTWVYKAVTTIADSQSRLNMEMRKGDPESGTLVEDHPLLPLLNRRPNPYESAKDFRFRVSTQLLLSKQGVFVEIVRNLKGEVAALHLLPPQYTAPIPDPRTFVSGYQVWVGGTRPEVLDASRVLWIKNPHPTDPYLSLTPLEVAGIDVDTNKYAKLYNRNFMQHDGRPGGILAVKGYMSPEDAQEMQRRFGPGSTPGRTSVIAADAVDYVDTSTAPRDAQYTESLKQTKEDILLAFGTPETVLGNASGRTFDNADAEFEVFWKVTMANHDDAIAAAFDRLTSDEVDDDLFLRHDTSQVGVLQREKRERRERVLAEVDAGHMTLDEARIELGDEPYDLPETRSLWMPSGKIAVAMNDEDRTLIASHLEELNAGQTDEGQQPEQQAVPGPAQRTLPGQPAVGRGRQLALGQGKSLRVVRR